MTSSLRQDSVKQTGMADDFPKTLSKTAVVPKTHFRNEKFAYIPSSLVVISKHADVVWALGDIIINILFLSLADLAHLVIALYWEVDSSVEARGQMIIKSRSLHTLLYYERSWTQTALFPWRFEWFLRGGPFNFYHDFFFSWPVAW